VHLPGRKCVVTTISPPERDWEWAKEMARMRKVSVTQVFVDSLAFYREEFDRSMAQIEKAARKAELEAKRTHRHYTTGKFDEPPVIL
jgi:hypothetical protein